MSANLYLIEDYDNVAAFRPKKTNPIQTQFAGQYSYSTRTLWQSNTPECKIKEIATTEFND